VIPEFLFLFLLGATGYCIYRLRRLHARYRELETSQAQLVEEGQRVLSFLHDVGEAFTEDQLKRDEIFKLIIRCAVKTAEAKSGAIFLLNSDGKTLEPAMIEGPFPPPHPPSDFMEDKLTSRAVYIEQVVKGQKLLLGEGPLGIVALTGKPLLVTDPAREPGLPKYESEILKIMTYMAVPIVFRDQVLGVLAMANKKTDEKFDHTDLSLVTSLSSQAAFAIYNARLHHIMAEKERLDRDLEIAREIQQILLPSECPQIEGIELKAITSSALEVGGDYFDFIRVDDNHWGLAIADVSGKGVAGALIMAMCRSALRTKAVGNLSPAQVLSQVNRVIHPDMREDMFISMNYGILDLQRRVFSFCRAGHEPLLVRRANPSHVEIVAPRGMALGIDSGTVFETAIQEFEVQLQKGDALIFYTDGVTEALDESGAEFDRDQLVEAVQASADQTAEQIATNIFERVKRFRGKRAQNDDITLLVVRVP
jgi:phosphoserine phosphatase RsbU/P